MTDRRTQGTMLLAIGGMALFLGRSDLTLSYVRAGIRPLLLASGAVLATLGLVALLGPYVRPPRPATGRWRLLPGRTAPALGPGAPAAELGDSAAHLWPGAPAADLRSRAPATGPGRPGGEQGGSRVAWLLVVPLLVLIMVAPPALGSYAAGRRQPAGAGGGAGGPMPPLERPVNGAVPMELSEFSYRALFDERHSLDGVRVRLLGFATPRRGGGYLLARFAMFCCAADAQVVEVAVRGDPVRRPADQWLLVEGHLRASLATGHGPDPDPDTVIPELVADSVTPVAAPRDRYEHTLFGY